MKFKFSNKGILTSSVIQPIVSAGPPSDYAAYYMFDGDATDETGNYNGTVVGATLTTDRFSNSNRAYSFDGSNDNINTSYSFPTGTNAKAISFWMKYDTTPHSHILSNGSTTVGGGFGMFFPTSTPPRFMGYGAAYDLPFTGTWAIDTWYHIVINYDGTDLTLYQDNVENATAARTLITTNESFTMGAATSASYLPYDGSISDVYIYDRALTVSEIDLLYNQANPI